MNFLSRNCPSAKVADGRLILSLPDAETPAVWVMDLPDAQTSVIRLETDSKGFYVLKKHGGGKAAPEVIAVYRDRDRGGCALKQASRALETARNSRVAANGQTIVTRQGSRIGRFALIFLSIWFVLYLFNLDRLAIRTILTPFMPAHEAPSVAMQMPMGMMIPMDTTGSQGGEQGGEDAPAAPAPAGVPMSADDFLRTQGPAYQ